MEVSEGDLSHSPRAGLALGLRQHAEALLALSDYALSHRTPEEVAHLLHELYVHQIELELQNEELRRAHEDLEVARARYFDLYDLAPVSYITLNDQGRIQEANLTTTTLIGLPRSALLQRPLALFVAPEDLDCYEHYLRTLRHADEPQVCELRMLRPDQTLFWTRLETTNFPTEADAAAMYRTVLIDVTSRVQAEAAVRELNASLDRQVVERTAALQQANADLSRALRLKDEFLSMMSHELRTPLSIILTQTESLLDDLYGPVEAPQRQALATIVQSGRHLLALLSDILDLARMTAGRIDLDRERINVALICEVVLQILAPTAQAKGIQLSHMLVPGTTEVYADERRLTQMLINLLDNALKFTPAGGSVALEVSTDPAHQQVHFSVWDNGIGIAPENQARIFAPFIQVDARLAREYTGTGLGLALVRQLVELHGGSISLVSALGQGSRFTVSLPCAPAP